MIENYPSSQKSRNNGNRQLKSDSEQSQDEFIDSDFHGKNPPTSNHKFKPLL